jgi:hypothetical protein
MRVVAIGLSAACSRTTQPTSPPEQRPMVTASPAKRERTLYVDRHLVIGTAGPTATRSAWVLPIDGTEATLVATTQEAAGAFAMARADREAVWRTTDTEMENGPVQRVGDHIALELSSPGNSLFLACWTRSIEVATAGAQRIPLAGHAGDCADRGTWSPATTTPVEALICGQGDGLDDGQVNGIDGQLGPLDETMFRFVAAPGVGFVEVNDGCFQSRGLRLAKPGS